MRKTPWAPRAEPKERPFKLWDPETEKSYAFHTLLEAETKARRLADQRSTTIEIRQWGSLVAWCGRDALDRMWTNLSNEGAQLL